METRMAELQTLIGSAQTDRERIAASNELAELCRDVAKEPEAFEYAFAQAFKVNSLTSPDGAFRIFNWNVPLQDGSFQYRLFVWPKGTKKLIEVHDHGQLTHDDELATYGTENWYGALYYEIHPVKTDGKTVYTLVGWDGNNAISTKKVLDVLVFDGKKDLYFGYPIFEMEPGKYVNRRVFEYAEDAIMNLRWVDTKSAIVFDRLEPRVSGAEGNYAYYGPGTGYSGYKQQKGKWMLEENMDMTRPRDKSNDARFNFPDRPDFSRKRDTINPLIGQ